VHDVVRHLCDVTTKWHALLRGEPLESSGLGEGFDPRATPMTWMERSTGEGPADTLRLFEQASAELLDEVDRRVNSGAADQIPFPYGTVPWSVIALHVFWDAWVHERDIVVALGRTHESSELESRAAAIYGLVMSGVPNGLLGTPLDETIALDGQGGGLFELEVRGATVTVRAGGEQDARDALRGPLPGVVDSLIGRDPNLADVLHGRAERVEALGKMRRFMLTPTG
jgi:hypothetical protein